MRLPLPAPIPPLALLGRKKRIACLGDGGGKDILAANIDALASDAAKFLVKTGWILPGKLRNALRHLLLPVEPESDTDNYSASRRG